MPTRTFGTNEKLCKARAASAKDKLLEALKSKGVDLSKFKISKVGGKVNGPKYKGDYELNKEVYQMHQYVELIRN